MQNFSLNNLLSRVFIFAIFLSSSLTSAFAAQPATTAESAPILSVAEKIMEESEGNVEIYIDSDLMKDIMEPPHGAKKQQKRVVTTTTKTNVGRGKISGFRIQVFSDGRNQNSLEARAKARGSAIAARFPKYRGQVYTYSSAPNWITRIGNFQTSSEASQALGELKRAFPSFAGEMRVVKADIYVIR